MVKMEHTRKMRKYINAAHQIQIGGTITSVYIKVNGNCTQKDKHSEVEIVIMGTNIKRFLLTYKKILMDGVTIHKELVTMEYKTSSDKVLSGEY